MFAVSTTRAATSLPALARSLGKLRKSGGSSRATIVTRASSAEPKTEEKTAEADSVKLQQQQAAPLQRRQRRRLGGGLFPTMGGLGGGLLSPGLGLGGGLLSNPLGDLDYELSRMLNEMQSMQDMMFGHRDTVGRIPDKLDFNCDILEKKKEFLITADLPGLSKDMVNITMDDDRRLHITAERAARHEEHDDEEEDVKMHVYERVYGKIERMFRLPDNADEDKIEASMKNGVLTVHIPKHPQAEEEEKKELHERQIKIK